MLHYGKSIVDNGQLINGDHTNINYSSIFTELIQAAGNLCEYYASDLFIDLKEIERAIDNCQERVFFLGFRDSGVDGKSFIESRLRQDKYGHEYIRLYRLELSIPNDHTYRMELKRVDAYDIRHELEI